jgi:tetratricopeptide (TPR) repeat protein
MRFAARPLAALPIVSILLAALTACSPGFRSGGLGGGGSLEGENLVYDRTACGTAPLPFWAALTAPEIQALRGRDQAAAGDPHALLDLAIFASGDVRTAEGYARIRQRFDAFADKERAALAGEKNPWQKGYRLHRDMHAAFFPNGTAAVKDGPQAGYDWDQSRLTGIFADGKFNCVSSALLYLILAREFGFQAEGVILPSHVFVQLTLPDGKRIEVETTFPAGFDWVHDEGFYRSRAASFFSSRRLPASTYADYQKRRIVPPYLVVAENMWNQHTGVGRMASEDRRRLMEARAWLDIDGALAQNNRLAFYTTEHAYLSGQRDSATLARLFAAVMPGMPALRKRWDRDTAMCDHIAWLPYYYADFLRGRGQPDAALPWIDSSLAWLHPESKEGAPLRKNNAAIIMRMAQEMGRKKEFARGEGYLLRYPVLLKEDGNMRAMLAWVYQEWSAEAWERKDWTGATETLAKSLPYADKKFLKALRANLGTAYCNWSIGYQNEGDWPKAKATLRKCLDKLPDEKRCRSQMDELVAQHKLDE